MEQSLSDYGSEDAAAVPDCSAGGSIAAHPTESGFIAAVRVDGSSNGVEENEAKSASPFVGPSEKQHEPREGNASEIKEGNNKPDVGRDVVKDSQDTERNHDDSDDPDAKHELDESTHDADTGDADTSQELVENNNTSAGNGDSTKKLVRNCHDEAFWYRLCERYQQFQERHPEKNVSQRFFLKSDEVPEIKGEAKDCRSFSRYWKRYEAGELNPDSTAKRRRRKLGGKRRGVFGSSFSTKLLRLGEPEEEPLSRPLPKLLPLGSRSLGSVTTSQQITQELPQEAQRGDEV